MTKRLYNPAVIDNMSVRPVEGTLRNASQYPLTRSATGWRDQCPEAGVQAEHRESEAQAEGCTSTALAKSSFVRFVTPGLSSSFFPQSSPQKWLARRAAASMITVGGP